jgi:rhamnogalacturonan endolyase
MTIARLAAAGSALALLTAVPPATAADPPACAATELFRDDFSRFPPGWLSRPVMMNGTLNGAIQEYHYLPHRGVPVGPWASAICHLDAWVAGDEDGVPYLEQHLARTAPQFSTPLFITGEPEWGDYTVGAKVRPLALDDFAGLAFRYATNRHYYLFALTGGNQVRLAVRQPVEKTLRTAEWRELGTAPFAYDTKSYYKLEVANDGPRIRAYVDGTLLIEATDAELLTGKAGLVANVPTRYQAFGVSACPPARAAIDGRIVQRDAELARLRAANPRPRLWKKFDTPRFGTGRNVRFGDLDGDGALDMLFAQNIPRIQGDTFDHISALTAVTLDGKVLWQSGRPDPRNGLLTNDTPFQIHDVDGDGKNDVLLVRDFKLQVLDGRTGAVKSWAWMPPIPANAPARPYELYSGDSIVFASLTGPGRRDLLLKDRYRNFWAFSRDLKPLWQGSDDTGHYPYPFDVDGDGRDDLFIGHSLWDHTGRRLWSLGGKLQDHVDAVAVGSFGVDPKAAPRVYWSSSDEAFLMLDLQGNVLKQVRVGHTQTAAVGKFREDVPGLQYMTTNFWRNPGIMSLFDAEGNLLQQAEPIHSGSVTLPVNWKGDGQDAPPPAGRVYAPARNPHYNDSNYRAHVSLPGWAPAPVR